MHLLGATHQTREDLSDSLSTGCFPWSPPRRGLPRRKPLLESHRPRQQCGLLLMSRSQLTGATTTCRRRRARNTDRRASAPRPLRTPRNSRRLMPATSGGGILTAKIRTLKVVGDDANIYNASSSLSLHPEAGRLNDRHPARQFVGDHARRLLRPGIEDRLEA
jgi:hypothetical protein